MSEHIMFWFGFSKILSPQSLGKKLFVPFFGWVTVLQQSNKHMFMASLGIPELFGVYEKF